MANLLIVIFLFFRTWQNFNPRKKLYYNCQNIYTQSMLIFSIFCGHAHVLEYPMEDPFIKIDNVHVWLHLALHSHCKPR